MGAEWSELIEEAVEGRLSKPPLGSLRTSAFFFPGIPSGQVHLCVMSMLDRVVLKGKGKYLPLAVHAAQTVRLCFVALYSNSVRRRKGIAQMGRDAP